MVTGSKYSASSAARSMRIYAVNRNVVYACGRYFGPARVVKTTNSGLNWLNLDMSSYANGLVDCYFFNQDSGFVVGGIDSFFQFSRAVILFTSNGGNSWITRYAGSLTAEWCWKIHFSNTLTGYVSIESYRFTDTVSYLKTTDRGNSWSRVTFEIETDSFHQQGIMFMPNNLTGWVGGYPGPPPFGNGKTYQSTDGGLTWSPQTWGYNVNRFRYINDTIAYAVGRTVYKYTTEPIGIQPISNQIPKDFWMGQNYPNPFNPNTIIRFQLPIRELVKIQVYDVLGREVETLVSEELNPGTFEVNWDASNYPSGIYFYKIITENFKESKKMILLK